MQDLTGDPRYPAHLTPSGMSAGGELHSSQFASLGATGSTSISAPSADIIPPETLPMPDFADAHGIPVSNMSHRVTSTTTTDPLRPPNPVDRFGGVTDTVNTHTDKARSPWSTGPFDDGA